jgi:hypothetical protein
MKLKTIGILDTNRCALSNAVAWLHAHTTNLDLTIEATSWGDLLTDKNFHQTRSYCAAAPRTG